MLVLVEPKMVPWLGRRLAESTTGAGLLLPGACVRTATLTNEHTSIGPLDLKVKGGKCARFDLGPFQVQFLCLIFVLNG